LLNFSERATELALVATQAFLITGVGSTGAYLGHVNCSGRSTTMGAMQYKKRAASGRQTTMDHLSDVIE